MSPHLHLLTFEAFKTFIATRDDNEVIDNLDGWYHCAIGLFTRSMIKDCYFLHTAIMTPTLVDNGFPRDVAMDLGNGLCNTMLDVKNLIAKHETLTVTY